MEGKTIIGVDGFLNYNGDLDNILKNPILMGKRIAIIATVSENGDSQWKTLVINALLQYLECDGSGNWLGPAWKNRFKNSFHSDHSSTQITPGLYFWSQPFIIENSKGVSIAILLVDVVQGGSKCPLLALAAMISTTVITISETTFQSGTVDLLSQLDSDNEGILYEEMEFKQLLALVFNTTSAVLGPGKGWEHLCLQLHENKNEVETFLKKVANKECWLLPQQDFNDSVSRPGKEFVKHMKKLFVSSILDADTIQVVCGNLNERFLYCVEKVRSALKSNVFSQQVNNSDTDFKISDVGTLPMEVEATSVSSHDDFEMFDLSDINEAINRDLNIVRSPPQLDAMCNQNLEQFESTKIYSATSSSPPLSNLNTSSLVQGTEDIISPPCATVTKEFPKHMTHEEMDDLLGDYVTQTVTEYSKWLVSIPSSDADIEAKHEQELFLRVKKFQDFCEENGFDRIEEKTNTLAKSLRIKYNQVYNSRRRGRGQEHIQKLEIKDQVGENQQNCGKPICMISKDEFAQLLKTQFNQIRDNYNQVVMDTFLQDLDCTATDIEKLHDDIRKHVTIQTIEFYKFHFMENYGDAEQEIEMFLRQLFAKTELSLEKIRNEKLEIDAEISLCINEYNKLMENEMSQIIQTQVHAIEEQWKISHVKILRKVTPKFHKYQNHFQKTMSELIPSKMKPFEDLAGAIFAYFSEMKKFLDTCRSLSEPKFQELTARNQDRVRNNFNHGNLMTLLNSGLVIASKFAEAKNLELLQSELQQVKFCVTHIKNLYNQEMKLRLESTTAWRLYDLRQMHEELLIDCVDAMNQACDFHRDSGIPDQVPLLREELEKCFVNHSNSNQLKLDKSVRVISTEIRKCKAQYFESMEEKLKTAVSRAKFDSLHTATLSEVSKLLEIELRNIPGDEDVQLHKTTLKNLVEVENVELRDENQEKWNDKMQQEKAENERKKKVAEEDRKRINKEEAERKKREKEEKERQVAFENQKRAEARKQKDALEKQTKQQQNSGTKKSELFVPINCSRDISGTYTTTNSDYGSCYSGSMQRSPAAVHLTVKSSAVPTQQTVSLQPVRKPLHPVTIAVEFGLTDLRVGVIKDGRLELIPSKWGNCLNSHEICITESRIFIGRGDCDDTQVTESLTMIEAMLQNDLEETTIDFKEKKLWISCKELRYALVLSKVKEYAENYLQMAVSGVVLTVPLWYNSKQRLEAKTAARIAGFCEVTLLNETTAVALACAAEESRLQSSNDLLVVAMNKLCDAAVYSYSPTEIRMISNSGSLQIPPSAGKSIFQLTTNFFVQKFWGETAKSDDTNEIEKVVKMTIDKCKDKKQLTEAAGVGDYGVIKAEIQKNRIARMIKHTTEHVVNGAGILADRIFTGSRMVPKDLSTLEFTCRVSGKRGKESFQLFPANFPISNKKKLDIGNKKKEFQIEILEGSVIIGTFEIRVNKEYKKQVVDISVEFRLESDGIFSNVINVQCTTRYEKRQVDTSYTSSFGKHTPDNINEMKKIVRNFIADS